MSADETNLLICQIAIEVDNMISLYVLVKAAHAIEWHMDYKIIHCFRDFYGVASAIL